MKYGAQRITSIQTPTRCVAGAGQSAGLTGRKGRSGWGPGIASRAGGAGLTGRNRRGAFCERGGFGLRACFGGDCCPPCHVLVVKPMPTSTHASRVTAWCVAGAGLRAGLTGRNRRGRVLNEELRVCARFAATGAHRPLVRSGSLMPPGSFHGSRSLPFPVLACLRSSCVRQQYAFAGPSTCLGVLRFPPDCGSGPVGLPACKASSISLA